MDPKLTQEAKKLIGVGVGVGLAAGITFFAVWMINYAHSLYRNGDLTSQ